MCFSSANARYRIPFQFSKIPAVTGVTVSETLNKKIEYGVALEQDPLWK
jgi:hypothetical protein